MLVPILPMSLVLVSALHGTMLPLSFTKPILFAIVDAFACKFVRNGNKIIRFDLISDNNMVMERLVDAVIETYEKILKS